MSVLQLDSVSKAVGDKQILRDVSFSVEPGTFVALVGRSGAGKSSLLSIAGGLDMDYGGRAVVAGKDWKTLSSAAAAKARGRELGFVFQIPRLFSGFDVWRNATAPAWIAGRTPDTDRVQKLLDRVGLGGKKDGAVLGLSGGERQRLTLCRALVNKPNLLLCDEPTGNLDAETGREIIDLLLELKREENLTVFIVTHDAEVIARADRVLRLQDGALVS